jgi:hypothetical protein
LYSDYGPLTLGETDSKSPDCGLPKLCLKDANLLIKLGPNPDKHWIFAHTKLVCELCPGFSPGLSPNWDLAASGPHKITDPHTGEIVKVHVHAIKLVDGTL